jgi:paired amphipathic helix protein Sin3a
MLARTSIVLIHLFDCLQIVPRRRAISICLLLNNSKHSSNTFSQNRFATQPEIYKQFLEILQTYQREAKPIQDVYAQVTTLFGSAPDLLEDFKQFLPDTTGQAKVQANSRVAMADELNNVRGEPGYIPQAQTPRPTAKMPPMGQFDPPSTSKDNKKRRGGPSGQNGPSAIDAAASSNRIVQVGNANKRQKLSNQRQQQTEAIITSPSLTPALPEPMAPFPNITSSLEELGFFDRARKHINNRSSYSEFLKLVSLFTQDVIDKYSLIDRAHGFLGTNLELMSYLRDFLNIEDQEDSIELKSRIDAGRVNLSHCRAYGPSYRHLPKRDQSKPCKGRDGMCYEVLNDVWASHPTWASEDSGFVAHRKNQHEEALHRIEEERHDYDFHIESGQRTIQLLEPLVQQVYAMTETDRSNFKLLTGFGGASESIPKRVINKIYGREAGGRILHELYTKPLAVMPIVLNRLKQKVEEWKATQREWEKVWRDQINKQFWKSLDHQGINIRSIDKKAFQSKQLVADIQHKYEEAKKKRENGEATKRHHLEYKFEDVDIIVDATRLMLVTLAHDRNDRNGFSQSDQERVRAWLLDFVPRFFGLNHEDFIESVRFEVDGPADQDGNESDEAGPRRGRKGGLLRNMFAKRNGNTDSAMNSKESTPMPTTEHEMDVDEELAASDTEEKPLPIWINLAYAPDATQDKSALKEVYPEEVYDHSTFNLYANQNIYCFFRMFEMLYTRLLGIKNNESQVREAIKRHHAVEERKKIAIDLRMVDKGPEYFFSSLKANSAHHFYHEILQQIEEVIQGNTELTHLEDTLRRYYNKTGWQLYTVDKLLTNLLRYVANILLGDVKDKSVEITNLFFKDRERPESTRRQELEYRRQVQNMTKDKEGEIFCIGYVCRF